MPFRDLPGVITCRFQAGEYLLRVGNPMPYVYYLKKGVVNIETIAKNGSVMVNLIKESDQITGSVVGLLDIFSKSFNGYATADMIAVTECICYRIPVEICKQYLRDHPKRMEEAFVMALDLIDHMEAFVGKKRDFTATQLIVEFMLGHSVEQKKGKVLGKEYTNVAIAKHLGIHSVTVSRILSVLQKEGCIKRTEEGIILLNIVVLHEYLNGQRTMKYD